MTTNKDKKKWGGAREGAGRPTLYSEKRRVQLYLSEDNIALINKYAQTKGVSKSDAFNYIVDTFFADNDID